MTKRYDFTMERFGKRFPENVFQSITEKNRFVKGFDDENFIDVARHLEGSHHVDHILPGCGIQ